MARLHDILGYEVLGTLGYGARSTIFAVRDQKNQVFALKRVIKQSEKDQRFVDQAILEHEIGSTLIHPALRRSYKLIRRRTMMRTSEVYVLMEMIDGYTFEQYKPNDLNELCVLCKCAAEGLRAMHQAGYLHGDIKPNNILVVDREHVKLIDFGQSCRIGTVKERIQGTPDYIAPEQVRRRELTARTDVFNFGATLYWLVTNNHVPTMIPKGKPGLSLRTEDTLEVPHALNPDVPPALSALIMDCVRNEPEDRPSNMQVVCERVDLALAQLSRRRSEVGDEVSSP